MATGQPRRFSYQIDARGRIVSVSPEWPAFARENDAPELTREAVVGQPLWRFVSGEETVRLYQLIFDRARERRAAILVPFRCDSPTLRRFMQLEVAALPDDELLLTGSLLRVEAREPIRLLERSTGRSEDWLEICSWCKRVRVPGNEWVPLEEAVRTLDLLESTELPNLAHVACAECRAVLRSKGENPPPA